MAEIHVYARPVQLYRYRNISNGKLEQEIKAIEEKYIYCPTNTELNDPMEGTHRLSTFFRKNKKSPTMAQDIRRYIEALGIASFSEIKNSEPMWAYYTKSFTGMCVSYSTRKLLSGLSDNYELVRMNYNEEPPVLLRNKETIEYRAKLALSSKTLRWSSEREWRLLGASAGPAKYKLRTTVSAIYLGSEIAQNHSKEIIRRARKIDVPVYETRIDKYQLKFTKI